MQRRPGLLLLLQALLPLAAGYAQGDIKHFLVLFMENRAFDHIFGCSADELPGIDGVTPGMGNWVDPANKSKGFVPVGCGAAQYVCTQNPDHSFVGTTKEIWGAGITDGARAPYPNATMSGYANYSLSSMRAFNASQLPIKIALAKEFGFFNNLYASIPGPSQPNHMFAQSATACGARPRLGCYTMSAVAGCRSFLRRRPTTRYSRMATKLPSTTTGASSRAACRATST